MENDFIKKIALKWEEEEIYIYIYIHSASLTASPDKCWSFQGSRAKGNSYGFCG